MHTCSISNLGVYIHNRFLYQYTSTNELYSLFVLLGPQGLVAQLVPVENAVNTNSNI